MSQPLPTCARGAGRPPRAQHACEWSIGMAGSVRSGSRPALGGLKNRQHRLPVREAKTPILNRAHLAAPRTPWSSRLKWLRVGDSFVRGVNTPISVREALGLCRSTLKQGVPGGGGAPMGSVAGWAFLLPAPDPSCIATVCIMLYTATTAFGVHPFSPKLLSLRDTRMTIPRKLSKL